MLKQVQFDSFHLPKPYNEVTVILYQGPF